MRRPTTQGHVRGRPLVGDAIARTRPCPISLIWARLRQHRSRVPSQECRELPSVSLPHDPAGAPAFATRPAPRGPGARSRGSRGSSGAWRRAGTAAHGLDRGQPDCLSPHGAPRRLNPRLTAAPRLESVDSSVVGSLLLALNVSGLLTPRWRRARGSAAAGVGPRRP